MILDELLRNKMVLVAASIIVGAYIVFLIAKLLKPAKSEYDKEIEVILNSDKHKVKGRFE